MQRLFVRPLTLDTHGIFINTEELYLEGKTSIGLRNALMVSMHRNHFGSQHKIFHRTEYSPVL